MWMDSPAVDVAVALLLGGPAAYLVYGFVRISRGRGGIAVLVAVLLHLAVFVWVPTPAPRQLPPKPAPVRVRLEPPRPPPPPPVAPPEPEEPEDTKPEPPPVVTPARPRKRTTAEPPKASVPANTEMTDPAPPRRFDLTQLNLGPGSGVVVQAGTPSRGSRVGGTGRAAEPGESTGDGVAASPDKGPSGSGWKPAPMLAIDTFPKTLHVPKPHCPAADQGVVAGTIILRVQVRRDGRVRKVLVEQGIGHGCDEIAAGALRSARFAPARNTAHTAVDFEIERYEYEFRID